MAKRLFIVGLALIVSLGLGKSLNAQNAIVGSGFSSGWGGGGCPTGNSNFSYLTASAGASYIRTTTASGTGNQYFRFGVDWSGTTTQLAVTLGSDVSISSSTSYSLNSNCTTSGGMFLNVGSTAYNYVFKTLNAGTNPTGTFVVFEVQGAVRSATTISQSPLSGSVTAGTAVVITAGLDGTLSTGQDVYLRYTSNNYSTSTVVKMTGSGTSYTATIPAGTNNAGANISYYVFTSGPANVNTGGTNADLYTINLNNTAGAILLIPS
jgi:hypothetical protein